jgi:hypothetical protein
MVNGSPVVTESGRLSRKLPRISGVTSLSLGLSQDEKKIKEVSTATHTTAKRCNLIGYSLLENIAAQKDDLSENDNRIKLSEYGLKVKQLVAPAAAFHLDFEPCYF